MGTTMQPQLQMTFGWRRHLIKQHDFFVQQMRDRIIAQFSNIEAEVDKYAENEYERIGSSQGSEYIYQDMGDVAEAANENAIEFYSLLNDLRKQATLSAIAGMYHCRGLRPVLVRWLRGGGGKGFLASHPQHRSHAHPEIPSNAADPGPLGARRDDRRYLVRVAVLKPSASQLNAVGLGSAQAGHDPLSDHRAFELGEHTQHLEHRPAGRRRCIEALLVQEQVDALGVEFAQEVQQVDQRPAEAIDRPGRDHVDVAPGHRLEQAIEARALVAALGARDAGILEELYHAPAVARGDLFQFTSLVFGGLLAGRDPQIDRDALLC
jgi:hypothetical protein